MRNPGPGQDQTGPADPEYPGDAGEFAGTGEQGTTILPRPARPPGTPAAGRPPLPPAPGSPSQPRYPSTARPQYPQPSGQSRPYPAPNRGERPAGSVPHGQIGYGPPPSPPGPPRRPTPPPAAAPAPAPAHRDRPAGPPSTAAPPYAPRHPQSRPQSPPQSPPQSSPQSPPPAARPGGGSSGSWPAHPYAPDPHEDRYGADSRTDQLPRPAAPPVPARRPPTEEGLPAPVREFARAAVEPIRHAPDRRGAHLPPYSEPLAQLPEVSRVVPDPAAATGGRSPRKLTVTRVAALRSRELTLRGARMFHRATTADGADESGLAHLTYAVMANYAVDAALAVALANTLFFAAAKAESTSKVLLYLVITVAPFAVIAPFIGPLLDRLQHGRRLALGLSSFGRAVLTVVMALDFNSNWVLYPCALGNLVLSKAFGVLKSSLTPRVLPKQITLVKTNSRLTVFGLIAGGVAGAIAAGFSKFTGSPGALFFTAACAVVGGWLCFRIPAWVESTEGEVPLRKAETGQRKGFPPNVVGALWSNSTIRIETGFLALFMAFVVKSQYANSSGFKQLLLLGVVGAAAGAGGFVGNALGARLNLSAPEKISLYSLGAVVLSAIIAAVVPGLATAALVGLIGSTSSSLAKVCLDSTIQHGLPEASRASAFGVSESVLQLTWVFGGVLGLLIGGVWSFGHASVYTIGFGTISALLALGTVQSILVNNGKSMVPGLRLHRRTRPPTPRPVVSGAGGGGYPMTPDPGQPGHPAPSGPNRTRRKTRIAGKDD